jgi:hypothetical protein
MCITLRGHQEIEALQLVRITREKLIESLKKSIESIELNFHKSRLKMTINTWS